MSAKGVKTATGHHGRSIFSQLTTWRKTGHEEITPPRNSNLWGNDGGATASAVMPFVKFPTNTGGLGNKQVEGGIFLPLAVELPYGWGMGIMTEFDIVSRENGGYGPDFINSITFSHNIFGHLAGYVEFFSQLSEGDLIITLAPDGPVREIDYPSQLS
jgi:hypothetical protein